jgi:hypothetical protein
MKKRITIYDYIASNVPNDAFILMSKSGNVTKAKDEKELVEQLKTFVRNNGSMGLMALAQIHPDKELIEQLISENRIEQESKNYSNASGSETTTNTTKITDEQKETISLSKMMIYGSFLLIGLALVIKNK